MGLRWRRAICFGPGSGIQGGAVPRPLVDFTREGFEAVTAHDFVAGLERIGPDVEKSAHTKRLEDHAATVLVGFDAVIHAGGGEDGFEAEGVFEFFGDVDEGGVVTLKKGGILLHARFTYCKAGGSEASAGPGAQGSRSYGVAGRNGK